MNVSGVNPKAKDQIIVALDYASLTQVSSLLTQLQGAVGFYKIGLELFSSYGWEAVEMVRKTGAKVFLDLKLHDIPNTVAKTAAVITKKGVDMFTVHTLGGSEMMMAAKKAVDDAVKGTAMRRPMILGVTILTSHSEESLARDLGMPKSINDQVLQLANLAADAGLDGIVSSPKELTLLRQNLGNRVKYVTPGIRPVGADVGDQKRVFTPDMAIRDGADYLVIGRPITEAKDPMAVLLNIYNSFK